MKNYELRIEDSVGLYIHIPFCKQACTYCNFHFSTQLKNTSALLEAIKTELHQRREYLESKRLHSIYFGGGTPSLLTVSELQELFQTIDTLFEVAGDAEITLEANPDDLTPEKIAALKDSPVNRLSIGIQSFYDDELQWMNRAHQSDQGIAALERVAVAGFRSWTLDLIYGTPFLTDDRWRESLQKVLDYGVPHLSAYQLTIEPRTALGYQMRNGTFHAPEESETVWQFETLMEWASSSGYEHYEISNLARAGHRAVHNSSYWKGIPYLGIGPSAHSFNGTEREWNVANNAQYIKGIGSGSARAGLEELTQDDRYNEYVMTALRTSDGVDAEKLEEFGEHYLRKFIKESREYVSLGLLLANDGRWILSNAGKVYADRIASELFMVSDGPEEKLAGQ